MPLLDIFGVSLADLDKVLEDPSWLMFGLAGAVGALGLAALILLYPLSRD
ncbi:MAG TPA: hypothetical protein VNN21_07090 [Dehalococcoidia bacterium]|jgi:hypothetical protein|nr:hypothetical protein [Dehalococcoidia bacterium]